MIRAALPSTLALALCCLYLASCSSAYYGALEQVGALESELGNIEQATAELIREMERSIAEANRFIDSMK